MFSNMFSSFALFFSIGNLKLYIAFLVIYIYTFKDNIKMSFCSLTTRKSLWQESFVYNHCCPEQNTQLKSIFTHFFLFYNFIQNGEKFMNDDCSMQCECSSGDLNCVSISCDVNAICKIEDHIRRCVCNELYEGDGLTCAGNINFLITQCFFFCFFL